MEKEERSKVRENLREGGREKGETGRADGGKEVKVKARARVHHASIPGAVVQKNVCRGASDLHGEDRTAHRAEGTKTPQS